MGRKWVIQVVSKFRYVYAWMLLLLFVCLCACVCVTSPTVLQPEKQEDGTVTGKDRWRQKLLSAMAAGIPVTPPLPSPSSCSFSHLPLAPSLPPLLLPVFPLLSFPLHSHLLVPLLQAAVYLFFSSCPILWLLHAQLLRYLFVQISIFFNLNPHIWF